MNHKKELLRGLWGKPQKSPQRLFHPIPCALNLRRACVVCCPSALLEFTCKVLRAPSAEKQQGCGVED